MAPSFSSVAEHSAEDDRVPQEEYLRLWHTVGSVERPRLYLIRVGGVPELGGHQANRDGALHGVHERNSGGIPSLSGTAAQYAGERLAL